MATALYDKGREAFAKGDIDWLNATIKVILIDTADYTVNLSTHEYLSDIPAAARVATATLSGKAVTNGVLDANDPTFNSVSGDQFEALVVYKHTGTESTSQLLAYIDNPPELPMTPDGGDIELQIDSGANKLFKL